MQVSTAVIYCLFAAGTVFGYAAIKPVLIKEGVYSDFCTAEESYDSGGTCYEQELRYNGHDWRIKYCCLSMINNRLNFMFTTAAVATNVCALPVGTILDKYGPRVSGISGSILLAIGALLLAFASQLPFDGYIPGYLFLALGGPFIFISSFQLSNTFSNHSGLILALLTGAFDSSSAIFLFYRLLYSASNGTFTLQKFFLIYLIVPVFILLAQFFIMPSNSYKTIGELVSGAEDPLMAVDHANPDSYDCEGIDRLREERRAHPESVVSEITSLLGKKDKDELDEQEAKKKETSGVWGALHGRSALDQLRTPWFILITTFTVVQMTRINYFVATIRTQYDYLLKSDLLAEHVNQVFDIALPLGGVLSVPFIGLVLDNSSTPFVLALLVTIATCVGVLGILPFTWAAYANIAIFVLYRPLYYTAVSDYAAKVFGFRTFGKVYGLIICLAGLLNFSQSALDAMTHKVFNGDPVPVNIVMLVIALVVGIALVGYVWQKSRSLARERLEEEAEETTNTPMPVVRETG